MVDITAITFYNTNNYYGSAYDYYQPTYSSKGSYYGARRAGSATASPSTPVRSTGTSRALTTRNGSVVNTNAVRSGDAQKQTVVGGKSYGNNTRATDARRITKTYTPSTTTRSATREIYGTKPSSSATRSVNPSSSTKRTYSPTPTPSKARSYSPSSSSSRSRSYTPSRSSTPSRSYTPSRSSSPSRSYNPSSSGSSSRSFSPSSSSPSRSYSPSSSASTRSSTPSSSSSSRSSSSPRRN